MGVEVGLSPDQSQKTCPLFPKQQNVGVGGPPELAYSLEEGTDPMDL